MLSRTRSSDSARAFEGSVFIDFATGTGLDLEVDADGGMWARRLYAIGIG